MRKRVRININCKLSEQFDEMKLSIAVEQLLSAWLARYPMKDDKQFRFVWDVDTISDEGVSNQEPSTGGEFHM